MNDKSCPMARETNVIGRKWSAFILIEMRKQDKIRFSELRKSLRPVTSKMLAKRLKELERGGLVVRKKKAANDGVEYSLTAKGDDMVRLLAGIRDFGIRWADES